MDEQRGAITSVHAGYCWIRGDDGIDRFAHRSSFKDLRGNFQELQRDQRVEFVHADAVKGPRALEIRIL